ncbi:hypothetical protein FO519_001891 [Halicephalobus sp. NKZ332]|nr:hypothetical protein FO519_001891 [Halicephalobus sp. NKZ332]
MVAGSIDDQLADCREIFCYFDSKGDEKINVAQVGDVLRALGQNPTEAEIQKCCEHWSDPDSRISFEEFVPIYQTVNKNRSSHSLDEFVEGLSHFDKDGNGTINVAELRHLLTTLGERLSDEEVDQLLSGHEDSHGNVNISDFAPRMTDQPSSSVSSIRKKTTEKRTTKTSKKDDSFASTAASISLSKMMGGGTGLEKQLTLEERSRDGIRAMLLETGVRSNEAGIDMLAVYARQLTKEALTRAHNYADHAERNQIEVEDVTLAFNGLTPKPVSRVERGDNAKVINTQELPKLRDSALHLPVDRCCIIQPEYEVIMEKPQEREPEPVPSKIQRTMKSAVGNSQMANILRGIDDVYD